MINTSLNSPKIVLIGGGTGSFTLLQELKEFTPHLTAIVNMSDDGGSTGVLRDELGVLPPGDIRQCLVALSDKPEVRDLFTYRFEKGSLAKQSVGNIILSALELQYEDLEKAIEVTGTLLGIRGQVIPVTTAKHTLVMHDGPKIVRGENNIGAHTIIHPTEVSLELSPRATINHRAAAAIEDADLVVISPGNFYCSLLPALSASGMTAAFESTKAKKILVTNLVTKPGHTDGWHVADYVIQLEKVIGKGQLTNIIYNNAAPPTELLKKYAADGEFPVATNPERMAEFKAEAIGVPLVSQKIYVPDKNDTIKRTLIRHDAYQTGRQLMRIFYG